MLYYIYIIRHSKRLSNLLGLGHLVIKGQKVGICAWYQKVTN